MKKDIFTIVDECLEKYIDGTVFFDELDRMVKFNEDIIADLFDKQQRQLEITNARTIASGEFGLALHNYEFPVDLIVQGGLRHGNQILDLSNFISPGKEYVFLDDSYFRGRTAQVVKEEVERCGGIFLGCCVIYDGCYNPPHNVYSLYRYYDYHDLLGRKIEK